MASMAAWGSMNAVISSGSRISQERSIGWTRQLRITPLRTADYFSAKILSGYMMALLSIIILAIAGTFIGVRLDAVGWFTLFGLLLVGLIPFAILGVLLGHLIKVDSLGPAIGGTTALFALLGGAFGPIGQSGFLIHFIELLPSYWLVQAGKAALGGPGWTAEGWLVIAAWSVALAAFAQRVYLRDTKRV
jgi:ABC-2 type transport system permease protein